MRSVDFILVGLGNYGSGLAECLLRRNKAIIGVDFDPEVLKRWRSRGISVLYGDMADPEIHEQLPLSKAGWVVSTVRSKELNLALMEHLKNRGYDGKVALTAADQEEADEFEKAGAHLVFRPFADAAEQAVDSLTYAVNFLPEKVDWPIAFLDVRIRSDSAVAGQTIRDLPLQSMMGVSILAVSRAGRLYYDPGPDFQIYPGDRLLTMGPPGGLREAETILNELKMTSDAETTDRFEIAEVRVADNSELSGRTLADLRFRQKHEVTVVGIRRGQDQITTVNPEEQILGGDCLIVIGTTKAVGTLKKQEPL